MVKVKEPLPYAAGDVIEVELWLAQIESIYTENQTNLIRNACLLGKLAGNEHTTESGESCLQQGLAMADILLDLEVDAETIAAAVIYESVQYAELTEEDVIEHLGVNVAKLVNGVSRMGAISLIGGVDEHCSRQQLENIKKMLLSMVDDVRGVLIKLAERLRVLRTVSQLPDKMRRPIGKEAMEIFAPLANRLGIGAIKWEMEDLSFRYLDPDKYKEIAKGLNAKRLERDQYVREIVTVFEEAIKKKGISNFDVYGRSKHIHSIFRKMQRKQLSLEEIYDATAFRVLVETIPQCYEVLSIVHEFWQQIPEEFDDYISSPKPNGYRSLHTAVIGPGNRNFEVQIRTVQMHEEAEMGVAAHWKYKEGGGPQRDSHEQKIEWLREVLAWQRECYSGEADLSLVANAYFDDRVYIFTPSGDVIDLPVGSTPLDFAYHIHSQVGHRCRGAKVNGKMVPLTHQLNTGEQVEILTGREEKPSLDWLNPHAHYLKSSRAKAKIHHWFKQQDFEKNRSEGALILERELARLELKSKGLNQVASHLNFKTSDDMIAALGRGDLRLSQIINRLAPKELEPIEPKLKASTEGTQQEQASDVVIEGVGNLLTTIARCCNPVPGEDIIGYITVGRGVSVHKKDCPNIILLSEQKKDRLLEITWGEANESLYKVDVLITAFDRPGLLRDVTQLLVHEKVNVYALSTNIDKESNEANIDLTIDVNGVDGLSRILMKLKQLNNVMMVKRKS
jgi:GTP pyrophosphokinase